MSPAPDTKQLWLDVLRAVQSAVPAPLPVCPDCQRPFQLAVRDCRSDKHTEMLLRLHLGSVQGLAAVNHIGRGSFSG